MASVLNFSRISEDVKVYLKKSLRLQVMGRYSTENLFGGAFLEPGYIRVPFYFGKTLSGCISRPTPEPLKCASFRGKLRDEQLIIFEQCRIHLEKESVVLLVSFAGFGKTIVACALASSLKMKTLVVVNRLCLLQQWKNSFSTFCSSDAVIIENETDFVSNAPFSIVNISRLKTANISVLKRFHTVILDETHLLFSKKGYQHLLRLAPFKLIGLTATDWRYDGLDPLFKLFYGPARVERKRTPSEEAQMTAVRVQTEFRPVVNGRGASQWSEVLSQSASDEERNRKIVAIVRHHAAVVFIILVKRVEQVKLLKDLLSDQHVACLTGSQQEFDREARIIIGTTQKLGTGFDFPRAGGLILAADVVQYIEQYIGRVMRRLDSQPLIFDFYDNYKALQKHFETRDRAYGKATKKMYNPLTNSYSQ